MNRPTTIHASAALVGEFGVLIRGASGSGKSALLLEMLAADPGGAWLVADDRVILEAVNGRLLAQVPADIAGLIEIRGIGIVRRPYVARVVVHLVVDLEQAGACPRLPEEDEASAALAGIAVPRLALPIGVGGGAMRVAAALGEIAAGSG